MSLVSFYVTVSYVLLLVAYCWDLKVDISVFRVLRTVYFIPSYMRV